MFTRKTRKPSRKLRKFFLRKKFNRIISYDDSGDKEYLGEGVGTIGAQLLGIAAIGIFTFIVAFMLFFIIKAIFGLRVDEKEENIGLDIGEHQMAAYN